MAESPDTDEVVTANIKGQVGRLARKQEVKKA
jgi:hypothetical protein